MTKCQELDHIKVMEKLILKTGKENSKFESNTDTLFHIL